MSGIKIKGQERKDQGGCAWSGEITAGHVDPRCWIPVAGDQYGEWLGDASDWGATDHYVFGSCDSWPSLLPVRSIAGVGSLGPGTVVCISRGLEG